MNDLVLDLKEIEKNYPDNPLEFFKNKKICLFKSCLERYFPGIRIGLQNLLEDLGLKVTTCVNQSCCSGTFFQRNLITRGQFAAINERNLNEIAHHADILIVSCNGCYNSILRARDVLKIPEVRGKTQEILDQLKEHPRGAKYPGKYDILEQPKLKIVHDLDFLHLIREQIMQSLKYDLKGLKVAVHYGCHYLNLERDKETPEEFVKDKTKLEDLIGLFGGTPVEYQEKENCCGWGASQFVIHIQEALKITCAKLKSAQSVGADFLVVPCPTCLYTLSKPEYRQKIFDLFGETLEIPTLHINELIAVLRDMPEQIKILQKAPNLDKLLKELWKRNNAIK